MRAGRKQNHLSNNNVPRGRRLGGTELKWLRLLSKSEVIWSFFSFSCLLFCSVYVAEMLKTKLQLVPSEILAQFEHILIGIYSIAVLGIIFLIISVVQISRGREAAKLTRTSGIAESSVEQRHLAEEEPSAEEERSAKKGSSALQEKFSVLEKPLVTALPNDLLSLKGDLNNFHDVLDTSPALVFTKDSSLNYSFANKEWLKAHDLVLGDVIGKNDSDVFGESAYFQNRVKSERNALQGIALKNTEERITTDRGDMIVLSNILPLDQGPGSALISWSTDITYLRHDFNELEQARQQADSSNQAKSSFLATMSHEIRTPMNGVVGSLDLLRISELDDSQRQLIDTINESAFALLTIIDDILDFSKIESGKLNLENVPVSFERLLGSVAASLMPNAQQKEVELLIYSDSKIPEVYADLVRLRQIVSNLGSNAIKFTGGKTDGKGRVIIRCMLSSIDDSGNATINIAVEDNGIGISEEAQNQLFQPFIQAEGSTTRRFGGSGLGLSITSRLTEMMKGEISVRSKLGEGAVFSVSIPFSIVPDDLSAPSESNLSGLPVLFVKGEERVNELFIKYLKNEEMPCYEVSRLEEEWSQVSIDHHGQLVIIIVDCWANDLGVPALKRELEKQFAYIDNLSFLILSQGYLMEPLLLTENTIKLDYNGLGRLAFLKAIEQLVNKSANSSVKTTIDVEAGTKGRGASAESNADKLLLLAEDNEVNQKVLEHQLSVLGYPVTIANDGQEALSLWMENKGKYHLILTDCHMPNLDGYGLATSIREEESGGHRIPIVAITADALQGTGEQCKQAGMDDYLTKPLLISDLSEKLEKWLYTTDDVAGLVNLEALSLTTEEEGEAEAGSEVVKHEESEAVDAETLRGFLGTTDPKKLSEFYLQYQLSSAPIVSEIRESSGEEHWSDLAALAHKLKSSSYAVGAKTLGDTCLALETAVGESDDAQGQICKTLTGQLLSQYAGVEAWIEMNYSNVQSVTSE